MAKAKKPTTVSKNPQDPVEKTVVKTETVIVVVETPKRYEEINFIDESKPVWNYSLLTDEDVTNYQNGTNYQLYKKFGSHSIQVNGVWGMYFSVWAPNATSVSVKGNFNDWKNNEYELNPRWDKSGIWEGFIPHFKLGEAYKYHIIGYAKRKIDKGDPFANFWEKRPQTASITWDMYYEWKDDEWMKTRKRNNSLDAPWAVYEIHLASWQRPDKNDEGSYNSYDEIRERLVPYVKEMGFTHVEFMPVMEHPFDGSFLCSHFKVRRSTGIDAFDRCFSSTRNRSDTGLGSLALSL